MSQADPTSLLLERWRAGDETAAEEIYRRYAERLWSMVQTRIGDRLGPRVGADDVLQSVFRTFFRRTRNGEFSADRSDSLWRLLVRITLQKFGQQARRHYSARRNVAAESYSLDDAVHPEAVAREPTPIEAAILAEELETALSGLDPTNAEILRLSLQGHSTPEIAQQVGCSRWSVRRVLDRIGFEVEQRLDVENEKN